LKIAKDEKNNLWSNRTTGDSTPFFFPLSPVWSDPVLFFERQALPEQQCSPGVSYTNKYLNKHPSLTFFIWNNIFPSCGYEYIEKMIVFII
jgi:hypothetical protein